MNNKTTQGKPRASLWLVGFVSFKILNVLISKHLLSLPLWFSERLQFKNNALVQTVLETNLISTQGDFVRREKSCGIKHLSKASEDTVVIPHLADFSVDKKLSAMIETNKSNPIVLSLDVYRGMICCFHMVIYKRWALNKEYEL